MAVHPIFTEINTDFELILSQGITKIFWIHHEIHVNNRSSIICQIFNKNLIMDDRLPKRQQVNNDAS